jgi:hypothetical protein
MTLVPFDPYLFYLKPFGSTCPVIFNAVIEGILFTTSIPLDYQAKNNEKIVHVIPVTEQS